MVIDHENANRIKLSRNIDPPCNEAGSVLSLYKHMQEAGT